jgi:hypothetical protein
MQVSEEFSAAMFEMHNSILSICLEQENREVYSGKLSNNQMPGSVQQ